MEITIPLEIRKDFERLLDDTASDGDVAGERAFLVDVVSFNSFSGGFESKTNILPVANAFGRFLSQQLLGVQEQSILLLKGFLYLLT